MEKEKNINDFYEQAYKQTAELKERARKWQVYRAAKNWIRPVDPFRKEGHKDNYFTKEMFVEHLKVSEEEAEKVIVKLIKEKKLEKTEDEGVYKAVRICTMCGRYFDELDLLENNYIWHSFGYGSMKHDTEIFEADLCAGCYDKIIDIIIPLFPSSPLKETSWEVPYDDPY